MSIKIHFCVNSVNKTIQLNANLLFVLVLPNKFYALRNYRKILVTGAAGFIGHHVCKFLLENTWSEVIGFDNFDNFYSPTIKEENLSDLLLNPKFKFVEGDICDVEALEDLDHAVDAIVHLAGKAGVRPSISDPASYYHVNVTGTQNLLEFAKNRRISQFVFASSSSTYGINAQIPWQETETLLPISPYASTKLAGEMLGHVYAHLNPMRFIALRFFTVYGPAQRPDLVIYKFFKAIINNQPITVYGDGSTSRDYTYIDDIVTGIYAALYYDKTNFEIVNIGNNDTITLNELIAAIEKTIGKKAIIHNLPMQPGDVKITYADITKAQKLLNYKPQTKIESGLKDFYNWFKTNENLLLHYS